MPVFIVDQPDAPSIIDECGIANDTFALPADTEQYFYAMTGHWVYAVEKAGFIFQQDLITSWPIVYTDVPCEVTPPIEEEPPVDVEIPEEETPAPAEEVVTRVVEDEPEVTIVPAEIESSSNDIAASLDGLDEAAPAAEATETKTLANTGAGDLLMIAWAAVALALLGVATKLRTPRAVKK
jgi:hypothetical protein